jgi:phage terminase large subunit-like protein
LASSLASLPEPERLEVLDGLSPNELTALEYDWRFWGRPNQIAPEGEWVFWLLLAGRGFGKTRTGAEWTREIKVTHSPIALVAPTAADARDVMVEGPAGILATSPPWDRPVYEPSKRRITWRNGAVASLFSADEPERLRGPQHAAAWCDEAAAWRYAQDAWDMLMFGLRLGSSPRCLITTTPRPIQLIRELLKAGNAVKTGGSTYENRSNLAPTFFAEVVAKYEGTRLGRQELQAELLDDIPGALWQRNLIDDLRRKVSDLTTDDLIATDGLERALGRRMRQINVAIDPAVTAGEDANETGITVQGVSSDGHGYLLEDVSGRLQPHEWARRAVDAFHRWDADFIVAEVNNGGDLVRDTIKAVDDKVPYRAVRASRGKFTRAEPIAALYEQKRMHHVGFFPTLEDQMCTMTSSFDPKMAGFSPDRLDAMVWGFTELMLKGSVIPMVGPIIFSIPRNATP